MARNSLGFGDDSSDSDHDSSSIPPSSHTRGNNVLAQSLLKQKPKPIEDIDESTYSYDDYYDSIQEARKVKLRKNNTKSDSSDTKYMASLLEAKKQREVDKLIVQDLKIQRERQLEGDEYKDKEEFVTSSYKEHREKLKGLRKSQEDETIIGTKDQTDPYHKNLKTLAEKDHLEGPRLREAENIMKQSDRAGDKTQVIKKSRLIPKLSDLEINEYRERYFQRKARST